MLVVIIFTVGHGCYGYGCCMDVMDVMVVVVVVVIVIFVPSFLPFASSFVRPFIHSTCSAQHLIIAAEYSGEWGKYILRNNGAIQRKSLMNSKDNPIKYFPKFFAEYPAAMILDE